MRGICLGLALALGGLGCAHTRTTDASSVSEPPKGASPPTDRPPARAHEDSGAGSRTASGTGSGTAIPVASSPEGLLAPGGEQHIRDKLVERGYLKKGDESQSTTAALRKFQQQRDLPETGIPDHETVKALGLDPNRIFKHADANE